MPRNPAPSGRLTDRLALGFVVLAAIALTIYKVRVAIAIGPDWDTYAFLANAADFAGKGFGYTEPHRAPLISLLTAIVFRFSALDISAIQWVDGALSASGVVAFYLLLRRRFDAIPSAGGALLLLAVQPLWDYVGVGYTDFGSVALSLWLLLACIMATENHPAWYLVAGPLFTAAIMMRYTAILFAFPALVWVTLRWRPFRQAKWILGGLGTAVAAYLPAAIHYTRLFGDALFPFVVAFAFSENVAVQGSEVQTQATGGWYVSQLPHFLAPAGFQFLGLLVLLLGGLGLVRGVGDYLTHTHSRGSRIAKAALGLAIGIVPQLSAGLVVRQVTLPIAVVLVWRSLAPYEESADRHRAVMPDAVLDATMLTTLLTYLDFHGHQTIQVSRYFITMAPAVIYLTLLGWRHWVRVLDELRLGLHSAGQAAESPSMRGLLGIGFALIAAVLIVVTVATTDREPTDGSWYYAHEASTSALNAARNTQSLVADIPSPLAYSDLWPMMSWYLRTDVRPMPFFEDARAFNHELDKQEVDLYYTIYPERFPAFDEYYENDLVTVLQRSGPGDANLPRVQYLGKSWDNYLESVTDYDFYLMGTAGRYGWEGSAFLDAFTSQELAQRDAVAAYGWRWLDRATGEAELEEYVREGGSLVVDASQNMDGLAYSVAGTIMFDTFIRSGTAPENGTLALEGEFAARHPELDTIDAAPFVDENGGRWTGATYAARPGTEPLETLVTLNGAPAVQVRRVGAGSIYFVGYNLVWHAFHAQNPDEAALVTAIFDDAIAAARSSR